MSEVLFTSIVYQSIINVFLIIRQNARVIRHVKREIQTSKLTLYHVNTGRLAYIATCIQCGSNTL
jgi:hypothetical protein